MVGCFLPSSLPQQHPPLACRKAACAFATVRGGVPIEVRTRLRLASLTSPFPMASAAPPLAEGLEAVAKKHCRPNRPSAHAEEETPCTFRELRWLGRGRGSLEWRCESIVASVRSLAGNWEQPLTSAAGEACVRPTERLFRGLGLRRPQSPGSQERGALSSRSPQSFLDASDGSWAPLLVPEVPLAPRLGVPRLAWKRGLSVG